MYEMRPTRPSFRVHLFGEFIVERLFPAPPDAPRYERVRYEEWQSRGPALSLLKALVCSPHRRASRDRLMEMLWPTDEDGESDHAFDSAVSILRKVMRIPQGESLLNKVRRAGVTLYSLPNQQYMWVDADAFEQSIDQAMKAERRGDDALPLWEAAYEVVTGRFLEDDLYSRWAEGRRCTLEAAHHRCVHRLVDLYLARNLENQAETLLQEIMLDDPTDEDALCRLLLLLEQQGRCQEGLHLYNQTVRILDEEYQACPSARTTALAQRLQHEPPIKASSQHKEGALAASSLSVPTSLLDRTSSRRQMLQEMLGVAGAALLTPPHELLNPDAWERLSKAVTKPTSIDEAVLRDLETITKSYWRLRANTSSSDLLNGVLGHFQTTIQMLRTVPATAAHDRLCSLAGEIAQMIGQMLFDTQDYATAWTFYTFSLNAAQEASNEDLRAVGLGRQSLLLAASGQFPRSLWLLQKAQQNTSLSQTIIRSWLAVVEAEVQAQLQKTDACLMALDRAREITAHASLEEDRYATGLNLSRMASYQGACYVHLHRPNEALAALDEAEALLDPLAIRRQSRLLTERATAYVQLQEIEQACRVAHQALSMTTQTRSMSVLQRLQRWRKHLNPWETLPIVKDVDEHITATSAVITS